jgi:hypothetical protein
MTPALGLLVGVVLMAAVVTLVGVWLRRGRLQWEQDCRFVCPQLDKAVECRMVQDVRTGQWKRVLSCTAFDDVCDLQCELECARLMNLGHRLAPFAWTAHAPHA